VKLYNVGVAVLATYSSETSEEKLSTVARDLKRTCWLWSLPTRPAPNMMRVPFRVIGVNEDHLSYFQDELKGLTEGSTPFSFLPLPRKVCSVVGKARAAFENALENPGWIVFSDNDAGLFYPNHFLSGLPSLGPKEVVVYLRHALREADKNKATVFMFEDRKRPKGDGIYVCKINPTFALRCPRNVLVISSKSKAIGEFLPQRFLEDFSRVAAEHDSGGKFMSSGLLTTEYRRRTDYMTSEDYKKCCQNFIKHFGLYKTKSNLRLIANELNRKRGFEYKK
jgi:hypothetical protein